MKSTAQMQSEMLKKARFDGGFPRAVIVGPGIIALAKNEEQYKRLRRHGAISHAILGTGLLVICILLLSYLGWFMSFIVW